MFFMHKNALKPIFTSCYAVSRPLLMAQAMLFIPGTLIREPAPGFRKAPRNARSDSGHERCIPKNSP
jgi:hypothetical protein